MAFVMETGGQVLGTASASLGGGPSQRGGGRRGNCILKTQGHSLPRAPLTPSRVAHATGSSGDTPGLRPREGEELA